LYLLQSKVMSRRNASVQSLLAIVVFALLCGCAASPETNEKAPSSVKPIDRVREGIVVVSGDLKRTMASADSPGDFSKDLQSTERSVATLRGDAAELRDRASDYLFVWGGQTYMVTGDSHATANDTRRDAVKGKYDNLVSELMSAKEIVLPLLAQYKAIESNKDPMTQRAAVMRAQADGTRAIQHLDNALARLDELKELIQASHD
jgi:hypothetical protein